MSKEFIEQSIQEGDRLKQAKAAQRKREIRTAWGIATGSLAAVVISTGLGTVAFIQSQIANQQKQEANQQTKIANQQTQIANQQKQEANQQTKIAFARQLATQANLKGNEGNLQEFSTLNASSQEFTLKLGLDSLSPEVVSLLKGIKPRILRFSPDQRLMAVTDDKFLRFFQIDSGKVKKVSLPGIIAISFSPDGKVLATAGQDGTLKLWDITGNKVYTIKGHSASLTAVAFSPDGKTLVTGSSDQTIKLWDITTGKLISILQGHNGNINSAVFSPNGMYLLTASEDHTARIWNIQGKPISVLSHNRPVRLAVFNPDQKNIVTVSGDTVVRIFSFSK